MTALFISLFSFTYTLMDRKSQVVVNYAFVSILAAYVIGVSVIYVKSMIRKRRWEKELQFSLAYLSIEHDWSVNEEGDFEGRFIYQIKNVGAKSLTLIPFEDIGWDVDPEFQLFDFQSLASVPEKKYEFERIKHGNHEDFFEWGGQRRRSVIKSWSIIVEPPLEPNDEITYALRIRTRASEKVAFTTKGGLAGIPVNFPTRRASIRYSAPIGYRFELLQDVLVFDGSGRRKHEIEQATSPPTLNKTQDVVTWVLEDPQIGHRYNYNYRLVKR